MALRVSPQRIDHEETKSTKVFYGLFFAPFVSSWSILIVSGRRSLRHERRLPRFAGFDLHTGPRRSLNTVINCQPQAYNAARDLSLSTNCARINSQTYHRETLLGRCALDALRRARHRRLAARRPSDRRARSIGLLPDRRRAALRHRLDQRGPRDRRRDVRRRADTASPGLGPHVLRRRRGDL